MPCCRHCKYMHRIESNPTKPNKYCLHPEHIEFTNDNDAIVPTIQEAKFNSNYCGSSMRHFEKKEGES